MATTVWFRANPDKVTGVDLPSLAGNQANVTRLEAQFAQGTMVETCEWKAGYQLW